MYTFDNSCRCSFFFDLRIWQVKYFVVPVAYIGRKHASRAWLCTLLLRNVWSKRRSRCGGGGAGCLVIRVMVCRLVFLSKWKWECSHAENLMQDRWCYVKYLVLEAREVSGGGWGCRRPGLMARWCRNMISMARVIQVWELADTEISLLNRDTCGGWLKSFEAASKFHSRF